MINMLFFSFQTLMEFLILFWTLVWNDHWIEMHWVTLPMSSAVLKQVIPLGLKCYQRSQTASLWIWKALGQPAASFKEIFHTGASSIPINLPTHLWNVHVRHPWGSFFHIPKFSNCFPDSPRLRVFLALVDVIQCRQRAVTTDCTWLSRLLYPPPHPSLTLQLPAVCLPRAVWHPRFLVPPVNLMNLLLSQHAPHGSVTSREHADPRELFVRVWTLSADPAVFFSAQPLHGSTETQWTCPKLL